MCKSELPNDLFLHPLIYHTLQQPYIEKNLLFYIVHQLLVNDTGDKVCQNGKVWHGGDALRKFLFASDVLFQCPQRAVWENDLWYVYLNFKVLVHKMVLLTSFDIFSISRNFAKL